MTHGYARFSGTVDIFSSEEAALLKEYMKSSDFLHDMENAIKAYLSKTGKTNVSIIATADAWEET